MQGYYYHPSFFAGSISLFLSLYSIKLRSSLLTRSFCFLAAATAVYAFGYGFELASSTLSGMLFWSKIQYIGISILPGLVLVVAICYTGQKKWQTRRQLMVIFIIPLITLVSRGLNDFHHLFYKTASINTAPPFPMLKFDIGPFYLLHVFYANITLIITTILFVRFFIRAAPFYRNQTIIMLVATFIQWLGFIIYLFVDIPWNLDINPILFAVSVPVYALGIFRFALFDLVPVARDTVFEGLKDGILVLDLENRLVDFNSVCKKIFPDISKQYIGSDISTIPGNPHKINEILSSNTSPQVDVSIMEKNKTLYFHLSTSALFDAENKKVGTIITFNDITLQKNMMIKLEKMASRDELTNIYNRRYLISLLEIEVAKAKRMDRPISILLIDLDHFKAVNDKFGHPFGDKVLRAFARIVKENIRNIDIFGRYGGDEFAIILPETSSKTAFAIADRIRESICRDLLAIDGKQINLTVSVGIFGTAENRSISLDELFDFADKALYKAKNMGRNRTFFHEEV
ncbi:histidine kinase N-terminal 7TM domain-containing protein [Desulfobacula sp.]|uniref:histidine kinase N-terminal 7TM domain-containing diguanylate cyclase n=1 Tax=Desulfobacula sp. TaxID=2593537 RepID=UPI0025BFFEF3|nr:histidine kinase N-terminal 7TM domain-containing protein [Desulfobacula sp.]